MELVRRVFAVVLIGICLALGIGAGAAADPRYEGRMAVVLVIDASGSMVWNDPDRVRVAAAQKTLDFLKDDDALALVEFASSARVIMPMRTVGGADSRREIRALMEQVGQRGDTDILGGLRLAYQQLADAPADARKFVILLSDGESDVPGITNTAQERKRYFGETEGLLARYVEHGWPVHCIGFYEREAGPELENIAGKTGGEYQFVAGIKELKNIFANILLAAKYPPGVRPVFHAELEERDRWLVGETLAARAYITIGEDRVLPGPYLELTGMNLVVSGADPEPLTIPFVESDEDGVFRAEAVLDRKGAYEVQVAATARYRGHELAESVPLGSITAEEAVRAPLVVVDPEQVRAAVKVAAYGAGVVLYVFLAGFAVLLWRLRRRERVRGELRAWADTHQDGQKYCRYRLPLAKARKREVRIVGGRDPDADFELEPIAREFRFLIRSTRDPFPETTRGGRLGHLLQGPKVLFEVVCEPGTVLQAGERLKSRDVLYDGDIFEVGGYIFDFRCLHIGKRPGGQEVLKSHYDVIGEPAQKDAKNKKKIVTLRLNK